jgi:hypothetical protein
MKYLLISVIALFTISCTVENKDSDSKKTGRFENIKTVEYDGHEYLLYDTGVGSSITHKENCKFH